MVLGGVGERAGKHLLGWGATSSSGGTSMSGSSTSSSMQLDATETCSVFPGISLGSGESSIISGFSSNETLFSDLFLPRLLGLSEERGLLKMEWVGGAPWRLLRGSSAMLASSS